MTRGDTSSRAVTPMVRDFDWLTLIDKKAAIREQFPSLQKVMRERPGTIRDRQNRELYEAESAALRTRMRNAQTAQEADADRFIQEMRQREQERFLARFNERKTA